MRIAEIAVDGFGQLRDRRLAPAPGLTLIRGENEAGKSTLLAFIRAILFGFETRAHPALAGGRRGGWLNLSTVDRGELRIERYGLTGGTGQLRILDRDGNELGPEQLSRILQGVERTVYNNVFAFGLAELAQFANLTSAEIAARIYGAGMGTGATSVVEIENRLEKRRSELFVKQGRNPRINTLLGEIDALDAQIEALDPPAQFRAAGSRRIELERTLADLTVEAEAAAIERGRLERLRDGWPAWRALLGARERAAAAPPLVDGAADRTAGLPVDLLERLARAEGDLAATADRAEELAGERAGLVAERDAAPVDEDLLAARTELERLLAGLPDLRADRARILDLEHSRADRSAALAEALRRLGPDWDEARLLGVDDSLAAQRAIAGPFRTSLEGVERDLAALRIEQAGAQQALADVLADAAADAETDARTDIRTDASGDARAGAGVRTTGRPGLGRLLGVGAILAVVGGLAALVAGLDTAQSIALGLVVGLVGVAAGWLIATPAPGRLPASDPDPARARRADSGARVRTAEGRSQAVAARLELAEAARTEAMAAWSTWLVERGLAADLDRESASRILDSAVMARDILAARDDLDRRRAAIEHRLDEAELAVAGLLERLGRPLDDPLAGLEILRRELTTSTAGQAVRTRANAALDRIDALAASNDQARQAAGEALAATLAAGAASDAADLRAVVAEAGRRAGLAGEIQAAENTLVALSGPGPARVAFEAGLAAFSDVAEIEVGLAGAVEHSRSIEARRAAAYQELGAERDRMAEIERSPEAASLRQARADRVAELEVLAETWSITTIALELLRRTRNRYEREHRPEVLKTAEGLLADWTEGRYARIRAPLGKQVQELERSDGTIVPISGLSTGTAEQLYLALRFGLVEHFAREAESLPIVMDDILVNFDPNRAARAARSIEDLASRHQVLYFTCHPGTPLEADLTIELPGLKAG
jgi:uncharacterized protein YhaN